MQRGAATAQLKQMIRKWEYEIMITGETPYGRRYKATCQESLDQLCEELGTREEC